MVLVSIIIPVYNAEKHLPKLVESLNGQTKHCFEVIFVDDRSTDGTVLALERLTKDAKFKTQIYVMEKNGGPGSARNKGITLAKGEWGCFVDADDYLSTNFIESVTSCIDESVDVVMTSVYKIWDNGKIDKNRFSLDRFIERSEDRKFLTCAMNIGPWGKIFKLSLWKKMNLQFPTNIIGEDGAVIPALYYYANSIAFCKDAVYYYYQVPVSRSRNSGAKFDDILQACILLEKLIPDQDVMEYKYTLAVGYGVIMNAIRHGEPKAVIFRYCDFLNEHVPNGMKNRYLSDVDWRKRLFIRFAYKKRYYMLKALVKIGKR